MVIEVWQQKKYLPCGFDCISQTVRSAVCIQIKINPDNTKIKDKRKLGLVWSDFEQLCEMFNKGNYGTET